MAHNPQLLILDEATSGLDPIVRDDILNMLLEFIQDDKHSVLISTHIVSDLEKIADYITFIKNGELIFSTIKDELIYNHAIIRCSKEQLSKVDKEDILAIMTKDYSIDILTPNKEKAKIKYDGYIIDNATIEEIMLIYTKGVQFERLTN